MNKYLMRVEHSACLAKVSLIGSIFLLMTAQTFGEETISERIHAKFPSVRQLPTAELASWLNDTNRPAPLLLDAREPEEFAISHLPQAQRVNPDAEVIQLITTLPTNRTVVVYCSVGYRSSALAGRLQKSGFTNVCNLEGSIFKWANEDRPLEHDGKPVKVVHPYNKKYSANLKESARAPLSK
ncbi:rhodanese-like domain-containing protein [Pedosphaera parvula]|uniref:rhodanese-like domain-containing protein n=1 Tax=Pedosphaera parvula TaxID=1032527 RepID=UPI00192CAC79|nr:rhodanese-like domain-containing protein [Pedosphaera parvula]